MLELISKVKQYLQNTATKIEKIADQIEPDIKKHRKITYEFRHGSKKAVFG